MLKWISIVSLFINFLRELIKNRKSAQEIERSLDQQTSRSKAQSYDLLVKALKARRKARVEFDLRVDNRDDSAGLSDGQIQRHPDTKA